MPGDLYIRTGERTFFDYIIEADDMFDLMSRFRLSNHQGEAIQVEIKRSAQPLPANSAD